MAPNTACPVVLRHRPHLEILALAHPLAGLQLLQGPIAPQESAAQAAVRALRIQSGLPVSGPVLDLGVWCAADQSQIWSFHLCPVSAPAQTWVQHSDDEAGHDLRLFWHRMDHRPTPQWQELSRGALAFLGETMGAQHQQQSQAWG